MEEIHNEEFEAGAESTTVESNPSHTINSWSSGSCASSISPTSPLTSPDSPTSSPSLCGGKQFIEAIRDLREENPLSPVSSTDAGADLSPSSMEERLTGADDHTQAPDTLTTSTADCPAFTNDHSHLASQNTPDSDHQLILNMNNASSSNIGLNSNNNNNNSDSSTSQVDTILSVYDFDPNNPEGLSDGGVNSEERSFVFSPRTYRDDEDDEGIENEIIYSSNSQGLAAGQDDRDGGVSVHSREGGSDEDDQGEDCQDSLADEEDSSSGFCSNSGGLISCYDNLSGVSYSPIGGSGAGQVNIGSYGGLILDGGGGLLLEDDDFGDNVEEEEDMDSPVERLIKRSNSVNSKMRENACLSIPSTLHQVMDCPEEVDALMELFHKLSTDQNQNVRIELIEQIPQLAVLCREYPHQLGRVMTQHLLPLTLSYVSNQVCQLRKTTQAALLVVLEQRLLAPEEVAKVCDVVTQLTQPNLTRTDEDRSEGLALMSRMAPILGKELTERFFLKRFTSLCLDSSSQIRKICAANFGEFTAIVGQETTERLLLPLFLGLCKDGLWDVRKSCADSFTEVSWCCVPSTRHTSLAAIYNALLIDTSRWVRVAAYINLGQFISTFAHPQALNRRRLNLDLEEQEQMYNAQESGTSASDDKQQQQQAGDTPQQHQSKLTSTMTSLPGTADKEPHTPSLLTESNRCSPVSPLPPVNLLLDTSESSSQLGLQQQYNSYNSFNYWRMPLPAIDIELEGVLGTEQQKVVESGEGEVEEIRERLESVALQETNNTQEEEVSTVAADSEEKKEDEELTASSESSSEESMEEEASSTEAAASSTVDDQTSSDSSPDNDEGSTSEESSEDDSEDSLSTSQNSSSPVRRRRPLPIDGESETPQQEGAEEHQVGGGGLERAGEPMQLSDMFRGATVSRVNDVSYGDEDDDDDDLLNSSNDSSDSDDTVIELSSLSDGLLSVDDDDNTSLAFRESLRRQRSTTATQDDFNNIREIWMDHDSNSKHEVLSIAEIENKARCQDVVPVNLIEHFLLMADPKKGDTEEKDISRHCAFAMPAVALTLGRDNWPVLRDTYKILSKNFQWRVRRAIAYSMHEVAAIVGGEYTTLDLVPIFKEYTVNESECVRIGVLENLAAFVRALPPHDRVTMLPHLKHFFGINDRRHRQEFGKQLSQIIDFYRPAECEEYLKVYALILLTDNVVYNRQNCYGLISKLIQRLGSEGDTSYVAKICDTLSSKFAMESSWSRRQTYVFIAGRVFADRVMSVELYARFILPQLVALAEDKVANVRLVVAQVMTEHLKDHDYFQDPNNLGYTELHNTYSRLQRDEDRDVRYYSMSPLSQGIDFLALNHTLDHHGHYFPVL